MMDRWTDWLADHDWVIPAGFCTGIAMVIGLGIWGAGRTNSRCEARCAPEPMVQIGGACLCAAEDRTLRVPRR